MAKMHSIVVSVDHETHRRAQLRARQLSVTVPEFALAALLNAVDIADLTVDAYSRSDGDEEGGINRLIQRIRTAHPDFRASDSLSRDQLYERTVRDRG
ncbi:MAG: hypothetical protein OXD50_11285 [Chloroflexi bacterium]|nr:hypothetical protein [Chloroflexota bacterium]